jgi:hypothetical protein
MAKNTGLAKSTKKTSESMAPKRLFGDFLLKKYQGLPR